MWPSPAASVWFERWRARREWVSCTVGGCGVCVTTAIYGNQPIHDFNSVVQAVPLMFTAHYAYRVSGVNRSRLGVCRLDAGCSPGPVSERVDPRGAAPQRSCVTLDQVSCIQPRPVLRAVRWRRACARGRQAAESQGVVKPWDMRGLARVTGAGRGMWIGGVLSWFRLRRRHESSPCTTRRACHLRRRHGRVGPLGWRPGSVEMTAPCRSFL